MKRENLKIVVVFRTGGQNNETLERREREIKEVERRDKYIDKLIYTLNLNRFFA